MIFPPSRPHCIVSQWYIVVFIAPITSIAACSPALGYGEYRDRDTHLHPSPTVDIPVIAVIVTYVPVADSVCGFRSTRIDPGGIICLLSAGVLHLQADTLCGRR